VIVAYYIGSYHVLLIERNKETILLIGNKWEGAVGTGWIWLRIGTGGWNL
jgi:hypothetical protein